MKKDVGIWWLQADWLTAYATFLLVLVTAVLAAYTYRLWRETKRAVHDTAAALSLAEGQLKETKKAVIAATRSATAAEKASHVERAWIIFDDFRSHRTKDTQLLDGSKQDGFIISSLWFNAGRTPALKVGATIDFRLINTDASTEAFAIVEPKVRSTVGQNRPFHSREIFLTAYQIQLVEERRKKLVVFSRVTYYDVFDHNIERVSEDTRFLHFNGTYIDDKGNLKDRLILQSTGTQNAHT